MHSGCCPLACHVAAHTTIRQEQHANSVSLVLSPSERCFRLTALFQSAQGPSAWSLHVLPVKDKRWNGDQGTVASLSLHMSRTPDRWRFAEVSSQPLVLAAMQRSTFSQRMLVLLPVVTHYTDIMYVRMMRWRCAASRTLGLACGAMTLDCLTTFQPIHQIKTCIARHVIRIATPRRLRA